MIYTKYNEINEKKCARNWSGALSRKEKSFFKHRYECKVRRIDAFTVSSGIGTGDPTVRKVILKKKFRPEK